MGRLQPALMRYAGSDQGALTLLRGRRCACTRPRPAPSRRAMCAPPLVRGRALGTPVRATRAGWACTHIQHSRDGILWPGLAGQSCPAERSSSSTCRRLRCTGAAGAQERTFCSTVLKSMKKGRQQCNSSVCSLHGDMVTGAGSFPQIAEHSQLSTSWKRP